MRFGGLLQIAVQKTAGWVHLSLLTQQVSIWQLIVFSFTSPYLSRMYFFISAFVTRPPKCSTAFFTIFHTYGLFAIAVVSHFVHHDTFSLLAKQDPPFSEKIHKTRCMRCAAGHRHLLELRNSVSVNCEILALDNARRRGATYGGMCTDITRLRRSLPGPHSLSMSITFLGITKTSLSLRWVM